MVFSNIGQVISGSTDILVKHIKIGSCMYNVKVCYDTVNKMISGSSGLTSYKEKRFGIQVLVHIENKGVI